MSGSDPKCHISSAERCSLDLRGVLDERSVDVIAILIAISRLKSPCNISLSQSDSLDMTPPWNNPYDTSTVGVGCGTSLLK